MPDLRKLHSAFRRVKGTFLQRYDRSSSTSKLSGRFPIYAVARGDGTEVVQTGETSWSSETRQDETDIHNQTDITIRYVKECTNTYISQHENPVVSKTSHSVVLLLKYEPPIQPGTIQPDYEAITRQTTNTRYECRNKLQHHDLVEQNGTPTKSEVDTSTSRLESNKALHQNRQENCAEETDNILNMKNNKQQTTINEITLASTTKINRDHVQLTDLPNELLLYICIFVPKDSNFAALKSTCRRLHSLMKEEYLWRNYCLRISTNLKLSLVRRVLLCATRSLTTLNVRYCLSVTDAFLRYVATGCPNLSYIDVGYCSLVSDIGLMALGARIQTLHSLCVCGTRLVTSEGIGTVLAAHCRTMNYLDISHCIGLERNAYKLSYLPDHCVNLTCLRFCWYKDFLNLIPLWEMRVSQFAASCPNLVQLEVSGSPVRDFKDAINAITNHCKLLRKLDLSKSAVNDAGLVKIAVKLPDLESLDISESAELSDVGLHSLSLGLQKLRCLNLSGCFRVTDEALVVMLHSLQLLRDLLLRSCYQITDAGFDGMPEVCPTLKYLDIGGTMITKKLLTRLKQNTPSTSKIIIMTNGCPFVYEDSAQNIWPEIPLSVFS